MRKEDFDDEVDAFHKSRDKVSFNSDDDKDDSEDDQDEHAVFNVTAADDSSEDDEDEDEEDLTGLAAKLARQAKYLRQKAGGAQEDEDEDEEGEKEEEEGGVWGKRRKAYYSADNVDYEIQSDDEEAPGEEEKEVLRLQKKMASALRPEDYEQNEEEESEEEDEEDKETTMEKELEKREETRKGEDKRKKGKKDKRVTIGDGGRTEGEISVEEIEKDVYALSKEEQMAVIMSEAPELVGLLEDLRTSMDEIKGKMEPLLIQVKAGNYATSEGLSYLEAKHLLLLSYCTAIVFYLLLRAEGKSVRDHPVIARLMEMRMYLEKIRPIDKKLQYQIDKLLKAASQEEEGDAEGNRTGGKMEDALKFRPNPDLLVSKLDEDTETGGGLYRPPKIAPMAMEEEANPRDSRNKARAEREARKRASRSSFVKELAAEMEGRPEEIQEGIVGETRDMQRERERLQKRAVEEENLFARVPLTKVERSRLKSLKGNRSALTGLLDDFDDDVGDIVRTENVPGGDISGMLNGGPPEDLLKRRKLSQVIAEAGRPAKKVKLPTGDSDLPVREDIGDRRRAFEMKEINKKSKRGRNDVEFDDDGGMEDEERGGNAEGNIEPEEDEFYKEAKERRSAKLAEKAVKYSREPVVYEEEEDLEGKRSISRDMEKNRGLTPHRNKLVRNPRKKYKVKHAKAVIQRKGQVREVQREMAPYGGQTTGIKANLTRSVKLGK